MRYWIDETDEDYEREEEQTQRLGLVPPAPVTDGEESAIFLLVAGEVLLWLALAVVLIFRLMV